MKIANKNNPDKLQPTRFADYLGLQYTSTVTKEHKKEEGQFFTPNDIASFMGSISSAPKSTNISILDPGCGTAILSSALIEKLSEFAINSIELVAYETDHSLLDYTDTSLQNLKNWLKSKGIEFKYSIISNDFIEDVANDIEKYKESFDYVISNPPYFKLSKDDRRVKLFQHLAKGQANIYSFFLAVSVNLLKPDGELIFIVPRSFASGQYFNSFRDYFFNEIHLTFVHLFKSRSKTFDRDKVLQETLILKGSKIVSNEVVISTSEGLKDLTQSIEKVYNRSEIIDLDSKAKILHLPTTKKEEKVMLLFKSWKNNLIDFGIQISTGPVVSFRNKEYLCDFLEKNQNSLAPLYWLNNISKMKITFPLNVKGKCQYITTSIKTKNVLLANKNYIFLRRFSSKDDKSRLIASPYFKEINNTQLIGVENKLNYIYKVNGELEKSEVIGIAALLNSDVYDTYFRTFNGNVNVSATEIRLLTFPKIEKIRKLGNYLIEMNDYSQETINYIVSGWLKNHMDIVYE